MPKRKKMFRVGDWEDFSEVDGSHFAPVLAQTIHSNPQPVFQLKVKRYKDGFRSAVCTATAGWPELTTIVSPKSKTLDQAKRVAKDLLRSMVAMQVLDLVEVEPNF